MYCHALLYYSRQQRMANKIVYLCLCVHFCLVVCLSANKWLDVVGFCWLVSGVLQLLLLLLHGLVVAVKVKILFGHDTRKNEEI